MGQSDIRKKLIIIFSKDALNQLTFIMLQNISISNKCCSLYPEKMHQDFHKNINIKCEYETRR